MKVAILVFPGSNCDHDCHYAVNHVMGVQGDFVWHKQTFLKGYDLVIIPGGFSYGDYLRAGAIARFSPVMTTLNEYAKSGGLIIGICNGFQILTEAGLLPGTLMRNRDLRFICDDVALNLRTVRACATSKGAVGQTYRMPIAHRDGNYLMTADGLKELRDNDQIVFTYAGENPNGSVADIAGVCSRDGRILGLMPHPERACEAEMGSMDGRMVFESLLH